MASPKLSFKAPWRMGDAVVSRGNAGQTTSKSGCPCPCCGQQRKCWTDNCPCCGWQRKCWTDNIKEWMSLSMLWSAEEMLDRQHQRMDVLVHAVVSRGNAGQTTTKNGCPCPCCGRQRKCWTDNNKEWMSLSMLSMFINYLVCTCTCCPN